MGLPNLRHLIFSLAQKGTQKTEPPYSPVFEAASDLLDPIKCIFGDNTFAFFTQTNHDSRSGGLLLGNLFRIHFLAIEWSLLGASGGRSKHANRNNQPPSHFRSLGNGKLYDRRLLSSKDHKTPTLNSAALVTLKRFQVPQGSQTKVRKKGTKVQSLEAKTPH